MGNDESQKNIRPRIPLQAMDGIQEAIRHYLACRVVEGTTAARDVEYAGRWLVGVMPSAGAHLPKHVASAPLLAHGRGNRMAREQNKLLRKRGTP